MTSKIIAIFAAVVFTAGIASTSQANDRYSFSSSAAGQHFVPAVGDNPIQGFITLVGHGEAYQG